MGLVVKKLIAHSKYFETKESGIKVFFPRSITRSIIKNPNDVWGMTVGQDLRVSDDYHEVEYG